MNILFVCKANAFRSPLAEYYFNKKAKKHRAESAGTSAKRFEGKTVRVLSKRSAEAEKIWKKLGLPAKLLDRMPRQLTFEMINKFDKIIAILENEEQLPDYLKFSKKCEFWRIDDGVSDKGKIRTYETHLKIVKEVKRKVESLIASL